MGRDIKLAAIDVVSLFLGFVLGAGTMSSFGPPDRFWAVVSGGAVVAMFVAVATQYCGLRIVREPFAGETSGALLVALPMALLAGGGAGSAVYRALGQGMGGAAAALGVAAVLVLASPRLVRRFVQDRLAFQAIPPGSRSQTAAATWPGST